MQSKTADITIFVLIIFLLMSGTHSRNKIWNDGKELWSDCVKKSPQKARAYINLGVTYYELGELDKAIEWLDKGIKIDPNSSYAYYNLSLVHQKLGNLKKAIEMAQKSLELDPTFYMVYYTLGGIYFESSQFEKAVENYKKFLKNYPYFPEVHNLMGVAYASLKIFDKAIEEFEWELKINPYHTMAHLNLGQIYWYEFQNKDKALKHLKVALALDPFLPNRREIQKLVHQLERLPKTEIGSPKELN
ncbi:MAG: tetratricopeptide repeat protein [Desulfobacterota bacterium]|nr:tetratricopeptide repeat protein [Thermodesulfobacteriota bacterium]